LTGSLEFLTGSFEFLTVLLLLRVLDRILRVLDSSFASVLDDPEDDPEALRENIMKPLRALFGLGTGSKTFKPLKSHKTRNQQQLSDYSRNTLGSGDILLSISLPDGCDLNEWLATNIVDFYNETSLLMGTLPEGSCTCVSMTASLRYEYLWSTETDKGVPIGKPVALPAQVYISNLFDWISTQLSDERFFPTSLHTPFPSTFQSDVRKIFRRLFRVYAHLYFHHAVDLEKVSAVVHLNTSYQHFLLFVTQFRLVDSKELEPLKDLNDALIEKSRLRPSPREGESKEPTSTTRVTEATISTESGGEKH
jgi:MOB kinase activator 1